MMIDKKMKMIEKKEIRYKWIERENEIKRDLILERYSIKEESEEIGGDIKIEVEVEKKEMKEEKENIRKIERR